MVGLLDFDDTQLQELVHTVDPGLCYVLDLNPVGRACKTLLVRDAVEGTQKILKIRPPSTNIWDETYFSHEIHALRRSNERNLDCVTRIMAEYRTDDYHAILKTYADGTPCHQLDPERLLKDISFIQQLDKLYLDLHLAGIAKINFQPQKFVITDDNSLILVDLSTCVVDTEVGMLQFSQEMRNDSRFISRLERTALKEARLSG